MRASTNATAGVARRSTEAFIPKPRLSVGERLALSVEEAGALLGISRDLAYDLVARGELPSVRLRDDRRR